MKKLLEELAVDNLVAPQDVGTAPVTGAVYFDVREARKFVVLAKAGAVTAAKKLTVTLKQATSAAGAGTKILGVAVESVGAGGTPPPDVEIEKIHEDLDHENGFLFVSVTLAIDEVGKLGAAYLVRGDRVHRP